MLDSGLYVKSKSPSASRPHIVRKTPTNAPKDVDIRKCGMRVCGDYRMPNEQQQKSFLSTANGTERRAFQAARVYLLLVDRQVQHVQRLFP